jgi:hypothetical protein
VEFLGQGRGYGLTMRDRPDDPESGAGEPKPPKIKAEDNPWYLLATLYGVPPVLYQYDELREWNRVAWNRYFAPNLAATERARLTEKKRHREGELTPFLPEELREIEQAFAQRKGATNFVLPKNTDRIDFSNVQFGGDISFDKYLLSECSFQDATFYSRATFAGATFFCRLEDDILGATFRGATFHDPVRFNDVHFFNWANFRGATFDGGASFNDVVFFDRALFVGAIFFGGAASFGGAKFFDGAEFSRANFSCESDFAEAMFSSGIFSKMADFRLASFSGPAQFESVKFLCAAAFERANFSNGVSFLKSAFSSAAKFENANFSGSTDFISATFEKSSSFVNAKLKSKTSFTGATFKTKPPEFFGTELHEGTVWPDRLAWPIPKGKDEADDFIHAYERLKLEMDRLKKHEDELDFFALELQSRRVLLGPWRGFPIALYGIFSDYGRSYALPFLSLLIVAAFGAMLLVFSDALPIEKSFGLSAANTLNVFGFRKDFFDPATIECLPAPLKILAALQTILGTILLLLFGLGVRNKFRMK